MKCNVNYYHQRYVPIFFHNLKGYDAHMIIKEAYKIKEELKVSNIKVIPNNYEKYMSFTIGKLKFIDTLQFMPTSLEKLAENLYDKDDRYKNFRFMKSIFPEHYEILCQKGVFPYEWFDDGDKLDYKGLPPRKAFYSTLKQDEAEEKQYEHALNVYKNPELREIARLPSGLSQNRCFTTS